MRDRSRPSASEQDSGGPAYDLGGCGASAFGRNRDGMELGATLRTGWYAFKVQRDGPLLSQVSTVNITIGVGMLKQSGNYLGLSRGPHMVHQRMCPWTASRGVEFTTQATQPPTSGDYRSN